MGRAVFLCRLSFLKTAHLLVRMPVAAAAAAAAGLPLCANANVDVGAAVRMNGAIEHG